MADELLVQADGLCGGNPWWNYNYPTSGARSCLFSGGGSMSSPLPPPSYCSVGGGGGDIGGDYGWNNYEDHSKGKLMTSSNFYDEQRQQLESSNLRFDSLQEGGDGLMDASSALEMIGFKFSPASSTSHVDWNQQSLFCSAGNNNYGETAVTSGLMMNNSNLMIQTEWNSLDSPSSIDQQQQAMNSSCSNCSTSSGDSSSITYEAAAASGGGANQLQLVPTTTTFPVNNYSSSSSSPSSLSSQQKYMSCTPPSMNIQDMLITDQVIADLQSQVSLFNNNFTSSSTAGMIMNNNDYVGNCQSNNGLVNGRKSGGHNNSLLSSSTAAALDDIRATLLGSTPNSSNYVLPNHYEPPSSNPNLPSKVMEQGHESRDSASKRSKNNEQPAFKRPRIETPSSLPTFKVRKEKLGDRITALQQLVSPFGKTDTASVLQEAIEYIKFLHDQVHVLTTPYSKTNGVAQHQQKQKRGHQLQQVNSDKQDGNDKPEVGLKQDLRSRGLCLVPLSTTFPVASETPVDFWTPTFGPTNFR